MILFMSHFISGDNKSAGTGAASSETQRDTESDSLEQQKLHREFLFHPSCCMQGLMEFNLDFIVINYKCIGTWH